MIAPDCLVATLHPWDGRPVEILDFDPNAARQCVTRDGATAHIRNEDLQVHIS